MNRRILTLCGLIAALAYQSIAAAADPILVDRDVEPMPGRGDDVVRKSVEVRLPGARLRYRGLGADQPRSEAIIEEYGDHFLGLFFGSPPRSNGGWSRWQFLRVWVRQGERTIAAERHMMLDDVYVLEHEPRRMVRLRWPLPSPDDVFTGSDAPALNVTVLKYPSMPDWLFLRVAVEGEGHEIEAVRLSSYPGHTAGPEERERWVATEQTRLNLHDGAHAVPADVAGLVFFNRLAHQRAGCLLVPASGEAEEVGVQGTYSVNARFSAVPGQRGMTFALGAFTDDDAEEVIDRFFVEWRPAVSAFMASIDWQPRFSWSRLKRRIERIDAYMAEESDPQWTEAWSTLKQRFHVAREHEAVMDAIAVGQAINEFRERLLRDRLDQWR